MMIAQIQLLDVEDHDAAIQQIDENKIQLMELANSLPSTMIRLGEDVRT